MNTVTFEPINTTHKEPDIFEWWIIQSKHNTEIRKLNITSFVKLMLTLTFFNSREIKMIKCLTSSTKRGVK